MGLEDRCLELLVLAQPSPLSAFNLDEAIAESLRAEAEFRRYNASATALTDCLESNGFVELSVDLTRDELLQGYEALTYVEPALASSGTSHFDSSIGSFVIRPIAPVMTVPPTALQFYFDLFGLGDPEKHAYNEVLVSYLHLHDDREQTYKLYACDSLADIEFLLSSIRNEPALIFTGRFQTRNGAYRMPLNTQRAQQRTLNAICVDIDPSHNGVEDEDGPIDPVVLERIFERIDGRLLPSYVCLTGRGIHLWYIFDEPLQTFRIHNPRRTKYKALADALYAYYGLICFDLPCVLDTHCTSLNHGFRAPGSLTKRGEIVRCFCPVDRVFKHSTVSPLSLSHVLASFDRLPYDSELVLCEDDVRWKSFEDIADEIEARQKAFEEKPASEDQLVFIRDLYEKGNLTQAEFDSAASLNAPGASILIQKGVRRRGRKQESGNRRPVRSRWKTRPHPLIAGETGGVYQTIYENLPKVPLGRRYLSLYMLAGVAYMMVQPVKTRKELQRDYLDLLNTPWAKMGTPLTRRDIDNALMGYKKDNWQTRNSEVRTLGFDPFGEPEKRNGRTRVAHLEEVARPAYSQKSRDEKTAAIASVLIENPGASKNFVSKVTGISYPTVLKYWVAACDLANVDDTRSGNHSI